MLPALFRKSANPSKSAFTRALERFRESCALAEKREFPALLEKPATPEEVHVRCRCAVTGRTYRTLFRRASVHGKFVPVAQFKEEHSHGHGLAHDGVAAQDSAIDMNEFTNWNQLACPWCGKKTVHSTIRCGRCRQWVCSGRGYIEEDGTVMHVCHRDCGHRASVHRFEGDVEAERTAAKSLPDRSRKALALQSRPVRSPAEMLEPPRKHRR